MLFTSGGGAGGGCVGRTGVPPRDECDGLVTDAFVELAGGVC